MSNPNIAMLENIISAAVSTQYKEVPPTEEEFLALAQTMRMSMGMFPVTDEEFADVLVRLRAAIVIQMDVSQPRIKNDALCFDISDKIVVDVNVAFLVIVHGIAFADLNFLNQANQRGTV